MITMTYAGEVYQAKKEEEEEEEEVEEWGEEEREHPTVWSGVQAGWL